MLVVNSILKMSKHISAIMKGQWQVAIVKAREGGGWHFCRDFFWEARIPCGNTYCALHSRRQLKVILLLILPNHRKSDFHVDEKDSNFTRSVEKKRGSTM